MRGEAGAIDLALIRARMVFAALAGFHSHAQAGRQSEAGAALTLAISLGTESLPVVERAIVQAQATDAQHRTQRTLAAFFVAKSEPQLHAANDHRPHSH